MYSLKTSKQNNKRSKYYLTFFRNQMKTNTTNQSTNQNYLIFAYKLTLTYTNKQTPNFKNEVKKKSEWEEDHNLRESNLVQHFKSINQSGLAYSSTMKSVSVPYPLTSRLSDLLNLRLPWIVWRLTRGNPPASSVSLWLVAVSDSWVLPPGRSEGRAFPVTENHKEQLLEHILN